MISSYVLQLLFRGIKVDYQKDFCLSFGQYVQAGYFSTLTLAMCLIQPSTVYFRRAETIS